MDLLGNMSKGFDTDKPQTPGSGIQIVEVTEIAGIITEENAVAIEQNLEMYRGDDRKFRVFAQEADGTAIDITGALEIYFSLKKKLSDTSYLFQKTKTGGGIVVNTPTNGEIAITIDNADTNSMPAGTYKYDVQLNDAAGKIHTIAIGNFVIKSEATRS